MVCNSTKDGSPTSTSKVELVCENCHKEFLREGYRANRTFKAGMRTYCTRECRSVHVKNNTIPRTTRRKKPVGSCVSCNQPSRPGKTKCGECAKKQNEVSRNKNKEKVANGICSECSNKAVPGRTTCQYHADRKNAAAIKNNKRLKEETFLAYGGAICRCCNECRLELLTIDHVEGEGNKHRREVSGGQGGSNLYRWLKRSSFPPGFQVLCFNCNVSKGFYGVCPHERERREQGLPSPLIQPIGVQ